jgi:hypothetical protein
MENEIAKLKKACQECAYSLLGPKKSNDRDEELVRTIIGIFVYAGYNASQVDAFTKDRKCGNLFDQDFLEKSGGNLCDLWKTHSDLAKIAVKTSGAGLGTPNAAAGAGELFLLMSSQNNIKPKKGDLEFKNSKGKVERVEIKRGGKIGSKVPYRSVNKAVVKTLQDLGIVNFQIDSKSKELVFLPGRSDFDHYMNMLSLDNRKLIWETWWNSQKLSSPLQECLNYSWDEVKWLWIYEILRQELSPTEITAFLIIHADNRYSVWRKPEDAIGYFKEHEKDLSFEFRAFQLNPASFYCPT